MAHGERLLVWKNHRFSIILADRPPFLDVKIYCIGLEVKLLINYNLKFDRVVFQALQGYRYHNDFQDELFGTLLVNTALQCLCDHFSSDTVVYVDMPDGDQDFWRAFGFIPSLGEWGRLSSNLGDLVVKKSAQVVKDYPTYIPLGHFKEVQPSYNYRRKRYLPGQQVGPHTIHRIVPG